MCHTAQTLVLVKLNVFLLMQINFISCLMKLLFISNPFSEVQLPRALFTKFLSWNEQQRCQQCSPSCLHIRRILTCWQYPAWSSLLSHSKFSRGFSWKVAPVQPQGHFFENVYYVKHESHSSLRNPAQPRFLSGCYLVMNKGETQNSLPHNEHFRATYRFQSCSGLKLGAERIICTCPETITDKHLPDTA